MRGATAALAAAALLACGADGGSATASPFTHAVVIVFENKDRAAITSTSAPNLVSLGRRYARLTDYHSVARPSLPNYLALVSGSTHGITSDCTRCTVTGETIGDQLTAAGRTWASYAEGYPSSPRFAKKHEPFLYFRQDVSHVQPLARFDPRRLPDFSLVVPDLCHDMHDCSIATVSLVVPDLCHDMHDCSIATGDRWLKKFVTPLLDIPDTVVFVVFDEGVHGDAVAAYALGTAVRPGPVFTGRTSHYGLLRTLEDAWGLPPLGRAATARHVSGIWK